MVAFHKLRRIARSSSAHKTECVSVMVSSTVGGSELYSDRKCSVAKMYTDMCSKRSTRGGSILDWLAQMLMLNST